jgi:hypothetical protein
MRLGRDDPGGRQDAERDGHVESGAVLAQIRGRQVHGDATKGILEAAVLDGAADAHAALLHAGVGQSDDVTAGQAVGHVDLDVNRRGLDTDHGRGKHMREHEAGLKRERCQPHARASAGFSRAPWPAGRNPSGHRPKPGRPRASY